jgi:CRISPR-associated protein Cas2
MIVIVLTACPEGLRGHLTRWLLEISAGVFVGHVTARVRNLLWTRVTELSHHGRALMVYSVHNEQRLAFAVHDHHWQPTDHEGIMLIRRPLPTHQQPAPDAPTGWSKASRRRRFAPRTPTLQPNQNPATPE